MASIKQSSGNLSLFGLLRSLVGAPSTRIRLKQSKITKPGTRATPAGAHKRGTGKEIFGQRKNCSSYTNR